MGNCIGFVVNRIFFLYIMSVMVFVDIGCDLYVIDCVIMMFGMFMGLFCLGDLVGYDVGVYVG